MSDDLLNILSHSNKDIDNQKLMDYLSGKLSGAEKNEVEQWLADNPFAEEALEGLEHFKDKKELQNYVHELNKHLSKYLAAKKDRRKKHLQVDTKWIYLAVLLVLALAVLGYYVLRRLKT
jgi:anti-sigma factor RsiW